jgi:ubiquinone/menaquinone biosynthesis C-methylase UbiE
MEINESTKRFSDRVADYVNYRPSYPLEVVDTLISECGLNSQSTIADIGSGTGIFSRLLLDKNFHVAGVEPNEGMRGAAEQQLSSYAKFASSGGQSERTCLADHSIDLVTAAQAFHWFKRDETRQEFVRVLKLGGQVALIWNQRKLEQSFQKEYDAMLREFATDYNSVNHMNIAYEAIADFFSPNKVLTFEFENTQVFDLAGFLGRMQSSSYTPAANTSEHGILMRAAEDLFSSYECDGVITFEYVTRLYLSSFSS